MNYSDLVAQIKVKKSFLCVGLDTDLEKIPAFLTRDTKDAGLPMFAFNKAIIDATAPYAVAFKPNVAFYEAAGADGMIVLKETVNYIKENHPEILVIADAKRGDIGNTSKMYAKAFFENLGADALTVAPYMGEDSVTPFLSYKDKWVVLLALTSNKGSRDFQFMEDVAGNTLYESVLECSKRWGGTKENMMYVVGATQASEEIANIRDIVPDNFLLVPGIGAQGGSLEDVAEYGMNENCGLLVNSSRGIIYAGHDETFMDAAKEEARKLQQQMENLLKKKQII